MSSIPPEWTSDLKPQTQEARRLEYVRHHLGYGKSLKKFWRALCEDWDDEEALSYPAVRNYHYNRPAPVKYYRRISEVFGVRLGWLIKGEGDLWEGNVHRARKELDEALADELSMYGEWPIQARVLFVEVLGWHALSAKGGKPLRSADVDRQSVIELGKDLYWFVMLPLQRQAWGFIDLGADARQLREYLCAMIQALSLAFRDRGEGLPLESAEGAVIRRLRHEWDARQEARAKRFYEEFFNLSG